MDATRRRPFNSDVNPDGADDVRLLLELSLHVTGTLDLQEVLDASLAALRRLVRFDGGSIQLVDDGALRIVAADPPPPPEVYGFRLPIDSGLGGRVVGGGAPLYSPDAAADPRVSQPQRKKAASGDVRSYFGVPLIMRGAAVGLVQIDSSDVDAFSPAQQRLVLSFVPTIAAAVQNAQIHAREQQTIAELRETQRLKNDFLAVVSHELRTPLTSIVGFGEVLSRHGGVLPPETVVDVGRRVSSAGSRLKRMIDDLLTLSQVHRGAMDVRMEECDVADLVGETVAEQARHGSHRIVARIEPAVPRAVADPVRLQQILGNLIENARKFSTPGSRIDVSARADGDGVVLSVADRGRGMTRDELDRVFDLFIQAEPAATRSVGGLGVGLYLARELCEMMGASLTVESTPGAGSRFLIRLRAARTADPSLLPSPSGTEIVV